MNQNPGDSSWYRGFRARDLRCQIGGRGQIVEGHQVDPLPAMCLAGPGPMRRSPMPSLFEDHAAISFRGVCGRARCGDVTSHGIVVGRVARRRPSARSGHADCFTAHANGRPWDQIGVTYGTVGAHCRGEARPPHQHGSEPGEWPHGWQYFASSASEHHFRETVVLAQSCAADQAHLRSHSGAGSSGSWPTLAKPTLASLFCYRVWPNRLWPAFFATDFGQNRLWPKPTLAQTDFGPNRLWPKPTLAKTDFGPNRLWPKPTLAKPTLAKIDFGQNEFDLLCVVLCVVCVVRVLFHGVRVGFHVWVLVSRFGLDRPSWDSPSAGPALRWTTLRRTTLRRTTLRRTTLRRTALRRTALPLDRPSPGPPALPLDRPSPGPPKISLLFSPLPPQN